MAHLTASLWIFSMESMQLTIQEDLIRDLLGANFALRLQMRRFRLTKPRVLLALLVTSAMCESNLSSLEIFTPR